MPLLGSGGQSSKHQRRSIRSARSRSAAAPGSGVRARIGLRHVGQPAAVLPRQPEAPHRRDRDHVTVRQIHDGQRAADRGGPTSASHRPNRLHPLHFGLGRLGGDHHEPAVGAELSRWSVGTAGLAFTGPVGGRPESAGNIVRPSQISSGNPVLGVSLGGANHQLSVPDLRNQGVRGPFPVVGERRSGDRPPMVPVGLGEGSLGKPAPGPRPVRAARQPGTPARTRARISYVSPVGGSGRN